MKMRERMMRAGVFGAAALVALALTGCSDCPPGGNPDSVFCHQRSTDAGMDAAPGDAGPADAGPDDLGPIDLGPDDLGPDDLGPIDLGADDAGPTDMGPDDAGPIDMGPDDLGPPDLGPPDLGPPDLGPPDLGPPDLGQPDLGPPDLGWRCSVRADCPAGETCLAGACTTCSTRADCGGVDTCLAGACVLCVPVAETCNGLDDNCNDLIDDGAPAGGACATNPNACLNGATACVTGATRCLDNAASPRPFGTPCAGGACNGAGTCTPTPVNCIGAWGSCSAACDGTQTYSVTTPAAFGGTACTAANGATRTCNTTRSYACPSGYSWSGLSLDCFSLDSAQDSNEMCCLNGSATVTCAVGSASVSGCTAVSAPHAVCF